MKQGGKNDNISELPGSVSGGSARLPKQFRLSRRRIIITAGIVTLCLVALWYFIVQPELHKKPAHDTSSLYYRQLQQAKAEPVPANRAQKVDYYLKLSQLYGRVGDKGQALAMILKADSYVTDNDRKEGYSLNRDIAAMYLDKGDRAKAREYLQRELSRLKASPYASENTERIKALEQEVRQL